MWVLYFISKFLIWRLGFELALQLKGWNLRAVQKWNSYEGFNLEHCSQTPTRRMLPADYSYVVSDVNYGVVGIFEVV